MASGADFVMKAKEKIIPLEVGELVLYYPSGWGSFRDPYNDRDTLQGESIEVVILAINWSYRIAAVQTVDGLLTTYAVPTGQLRRP